ncbi:MAG: hypothetical protein LBQ89_02825 [Treponema sp.]|jgi:hypothetical protein|nr:hypothetical protein [Treponema sp.]
MENKNLRLLFFMAVILAVSCISVTGCGTQQGSTETGGGRTIENTAVNHGGNDTSSGKTDEAEEVGTQAIEDVFDPAAVSQAYYISTMEEVQHFIEELNQIISGRNYNAWRAALSAEYFAQISSPENLRQISEQPAMTTRRIVLTTAEDYFINVVVPSRANSHADDIEFIERNRVKVFTINVNRAGEEQRLRLYDLEKIGDSWKIIN